MRRHDIPGQAEAYRDHAFREGPADRERDDPQEAR